MQTEKQITTEQAYSRLAALCSRSEHCSHDMLEKMRQWGISPDDQEQVLDRLVGGRYIDDERFARAFVHDKVRYNKWGRRKVEQALWVKHIDKEVCQRVLSEIDDEAYVSALKPLLRQKQRNKVPYPKLVRFAMGRGFTMDIIKQCIDIEDEDEFLD